MNFIQRHQQRLIEAGFNPGPVDGDWGRKTQLATDAYRRSLGALIPIYVPIAERELGVKEYPGEADNPRVLEYHRHTNLKASDDEVPWCSSFMNAVMDWAGIPKTDSAAASSWLNWGNPAPAQTYGSIAIFHRTGGNHVGLVVGWDSQNLAILGGNQSDMVCVRPFPFTTLRGVRRMES